MYIYGRKLSCPEAGPYVWTDENLGELSTEIYGPHLLGEFQLNRLPPNVQQHFSRGGASWRDAVVEAIGTGIKNPNVLADLIFFLQHPTRMTAGVGKLINRRESDFVKLRAEWILYRTIVTRFLRPAAACTVFLPANRTRGYESYVAAPTTGRITLMINGRNERGSPRDQTEAFDSMQKTVESLGPNDSIFLANWQFAPTEVPLTAPGSAGMRTWGDLFKGKAKEGAKIRIIISDLPPVAARFQTNPTPLNNIIGELPVSARDNLKYIFSKHPANLVASHHQKFMVVKKDKTIVAYCGGLDISFNRTPAGGPPTSSGMISTRSWRASSHEIWSESLYFAGIAKKTSPREAGYLAGRVLKHWRRLP